MADLTTYKLATRSYSRTTLKRCLFCGARGSWRYDRVGQSFFYACDDCKEADKHKAYVMLAFRACAGQHCPTDCRALLPWVWDHLKDAQTTKMPRRIAAVRERIAR